MLEIRDVGFRYPAASLPALQRISFQVERGKVMGLLGPNGAGKTTLLSILSGRHGKHDGIILIDGKPLADVRRREPTRITTAPQEYAFYPMLSVRENLQCFAAACGLSRMRAAKQMQECMDATQLHLFANTRAANLSGGLKRRLNLAIALLPAPEIILLDEPTVGVDPQSRVFLLDKVRSLADRGAMVIYASHYMEEIEAIADLVAILDHGQLLVTGPLHTLLGQCGSEMLIRVEGLSLRDTASILSRFGSVSFDDNDSAFRLEGNEFQSVVLSSLEESGAKVQMVSYGTRNLEHLFLKLTNRSLRDT